MKGKSYVPNSYACTRPSIKKSAATIHRCVEQIPGTQRVQEFLLTRSDLMAHGMANMTLSRLSPAKKTPLWSQDLINSYLIWHVGRGYINWESPIPKYAKSSSLLPLKLCYWWWWNKHCMRFQGRMKCAVNFRAELWGNRKPSWEKNIFFFLSSVREKWFLSPPVQLARWFRMHRVASQYPWYFGHFSLYCLVMNDCMDMKF